MQNLVLYLCAYLIAGIPFGLILTKLFAKVDIKNEGSKNIGATNVLRVVKKSNPSLARRLSVLTVLLDILKGVLPILIARVYGVDIGVQWSMAVLAVLGHCFSPYLKLEGGKGVATGCGVMLLFTPMAVLIALLVWALSAKMLKISSLASLCALLAFIIASFLLYPNIEGINTHAPILVIAFLIFYKHIPNIKRMIFKEECKLV